MCHVASRHSRLSLESTCTFLKEEEKGSVFGGFSCGSPNTDGLPCQHIVSVVKSSRIEGLTPVPVNFMPQWWMILHWRKQYPSHSALSCNFNMMSLRMTSPNTSLKYCPPYIAPNKSGCPKMNKRINSLTNMGAHERPFFNKLH